MARQVYNPYGGMFNFNKWQGAPGYTDWGALDPQTQQLLQSWNKGFNSGDVIYGTNPMTGFARRQMGREPYAIKNSFINKVKNGVANTGDAVLDAGVETVLGAGGAGANVPRSNRVIKSNPKAGTVKQGSLPKGTAIKGTPKPASKFGWNLKDGAKVFGKNIGKAANIGSGIMYGAQALGNMNALNESRDSADDLIDQILISANNNPIANSYLTSEQKAMLNKARRGDLDTETSIDDFIPDDLLGNIGDIGLGVLMGLPGGLPGMIIGGAGSAINAGLEDSMQEQQSQVAELEALLQALQDAELQYQSMKRPNFTGLGIQQRYQNMYM